MVEVDCVVSVVCGVVLFFVLDYFLNRDDPVFRPAVVVVWERIRRWCRR